MPHKRTPSPSVPPRLHASRGARPHVSRWASARDLLSPGQLRDSMAVAPPPSVRTALIAGMQAALAVLLALVSTRLSPWPEMVGFPALGALAALYGRYASFRLRPRLVMISGGLLTLAVLLPSLAAWGGATYAMLIVLLAILAGGAFLAASHWNLGGPGAVLMVFAIGAVLSPGATGAEVAARTLGTVWGAALAFAVCRLTDRLRPESVPAVVAQAAPAAPWRSQLVVAGRLAVGCGAAAFVAHAAGWHHPAWAAIGATAVMQGSTLHLSMNRALQRMAGTVVGACIAWAILAQQPGFWAMVAAIVFFQFVTEAIIGFNYALGQITVTPMALFMTQLASPVVHADMPVERIMDTIVGAALGIVFALLFSSLDDRHDLAARRRRFPHVHQ